MEKRQKVLARLAESVNEIQIHIKRVKFKHTLSKRYFRSQLLFIFWPLSTQNLKQP